MVTITQPKLEEREVGERESGSWERPIAPPSAPPTYTVLVTQGDGDPGGESSRHLSTLRLRAFMKKLETVEGSRPSCLAMVTCISLLGRLVS